MHRLAASGAAPVKVGFVVSRAVGPAVVRNRVKRQLREQMRGRLDRLAPGTVYVVRANPGAAVASSRELSADLDRCLATVEDGNR
jgi:ribonuclease P protein component